MTTVVLAFSKAFLVKFSDYSVWIALATLLIVVIIYLFAGISMVRIFWIAKAANIQWGVLTAIALFEVMIVLVMVYVGFALGRNTIPIL